MGKITERHNQKAAKEAASGSKGRGQVCSYLELRIVASRIVKESLGLPGDSVSQS